MRHAPFGSPLCRNFAKAKIFVLLLTVEKTGRLKRALRTMFQGHARYCYSSNTDWATFRP